MGCKQRVVWLALAVAGWRAAAAAPATYDLRLVSHNLPPVLSAGDRISVRVEVANDGQVVWDPEEGFALSYHWIGESSDVEIWDGVRSPLPATVEPGSTASVTASVEVPRRAGLYRLVWDIVHENVLWVSEVDPTPVAGIRVRVEADYGFKIVSQSPPRFLTAGAKAGAQLVLENSGSREWPADGSVALSYHWRHASGDVVQWEGRRSPIPTNVAANQRVKVAVTIGAPRRAGLYRLEWDLVEEGVCWFSQRMAAPPPARLVMVLPGLAVGPGWWALLVLLAGAASVSVLVRGAPRPLVALFAAGDLLWCTASLAVKQAFVLAEAGARMTGEAWFLTIGGAAALVLVAGVLPRRLRPWARWLVVVLATLVLWGDALYLRFFHDLPSPAALAALHQVERVEASVGSLLTIRDLWMWLDLLPGAVLVMVASRLGGTTGRRSRRVAIALFAGAVAAGALAGVRCAAREPALLEQMFRRVQAARHIGLLNLHAVDGARHLRQADRHDLEATRFAEVVDWFAQRSSLRAGDGPWFAAAEGANLVMVQVESLQAFVVGLEVNGEEITPFLNRWRESALYFPGLADQTGQGRSSDSELATQASLLPMAGGAAAFRYAANDFTGLAEVLAGRGYGTLSAVPFEGGFWNRRLTHQAFGFQRSLFVDDFAGGERIGWGLNDRDFLAQASTRLAAAKRPFCAYLLTLSLHHPFAGFPEHLKVLDVSPWEGTPLGNYLHTMHFFDASLSAFLADLEKEGLADSTVIAIWGDHDAGFAWKPEVAAIMGVDFSSAGWYLSQEVPFFVKLPGLQGPRGERRAVAGHTDVAPTLLALLGVDPAPFAFVGRNLLGAGGEAPVVGEYGCWRDARHLFLQGDGSLEGGSCLEGANLQPVAAEACAESFAEARRTEASSALVLEYDLQETIHRELAARRARISHRVSLRGPQP